MLKEVFPVVPEYSEAKRLHKFLSYILPIAEKDIPSSYILREFLDGSSFDNSQLYFRSVHPFLAKSQKILKINI